MAFQTFTPEQAVPKIKQYCAYQERCHSEVRDKLYSFGLHKNEVEEIISTLITENYLNEERFAIHFAGGKFRMKQWGKVKIKKALKYKQVSDYCIRKALKEIDALRLRKNFQETGRTKVENIKKRKKYFYKKKKVTGFLIAKRF